MVKNTKKEEGKEVCEFNDNEIISSEYFASQDRLLLTFKKGKKYEYHPVNAYIYLRFKSARIQAEYFMKNIMNNKKIKHKPV